jgi:hypothetical protein
VLRSELGSRSQRERRQPQKAVRDAEERSNGQMRPGRIMPQDGTPCPGVKTCPRPETTPIEPGARNLISPGWASCGSQVLSD